MEHSWREILRLESMKENQQTTHRIYEGKSADSLTESMKENR